MRENRILAGLPSGERRLFLPSLDPIRLYVGDVIDYAGQPVRYLYFPTSAGLSIVNQQAQPNEAQLLDVSVVGKEGCTGGSIVQGSDKSASMVLVEIGGSAVRLPASEVLGYRAQVPYLWQAVARCNLLLYRHAVISVGCTRFHPAEQRAARWLRAHWHRTGVESFPFSAAFFAAQVGIDEKTSTAILQAFAADGIVSLSLNNITILDHEKLALTACECFEQAKAATEEYLVDLDKIANAHDQR
ncbi:MAG TPA: helix-turn-helix domain-containing protein [Nitrospira sp.]|nr:helix-turn-helix domain-containing protein [Nitrospira sp.]